VPQELKKKITKKKQKNTKRDATKRSTCKPLASFKRWFVFHFIGSPYENETSAQEIGPPMPTAFTSDSGCQPGIDFYGTQERTPPVFLSKMYEKVSDFLSDLNSWCEARTPTHTNNRWSLMTTHRYPVNRLLIDLGMIPNRHRPSCPLTEPPWLTHCW